MVRKVTHFSGYIQFLMLDFSPIYVRSIAAYALLSHTIFLAETGFPEVAAVIQNDLLLHGVGCY